MIFTMLEQAGTRCAILRPNERSSRERGGGIRTTYLVSKSAGSTRLLNGITEIDPGASVPLHAHNCEESVMVLEGQAIIEVDGAKHRLNLHDTTWLAANVPHRFSNASVTARLKIFWTYSSIDATRTMASTGKVSSIESEEA